MLFRSRGVEGEGLGPGLVGRQAPDEVHVALPRLVQLGALAQDLVVDGEGHGLGLLQLEPVDRHLHTHTHAMTWVTFEGFAVFVRIDPK